MAAVKPASQTTAALQTPSGRGGIAVIHLKGPASGRILAAVFRPFKAYARSGQGLLQLGHLVADKQVIDEAVVHHGDEAAEINIHGGPQVARATLQLLARCGATIAAAAPAATESFPLAHPHWDNPAVGAELLEVLPLAGSALIVAALTQQWSGGVSRLAAAPDATAEQLRRAARGLTTMRRLLEPPEVVLAGPPNAGKSALTNALIGRNVSLVHDSPGTTRDWVREQALFEGIAIWLTDTAGIWRPPAGVDAEAVRRARQRVEQADLVLLLGGAGAAEPPDWIDATKTLRVGAKCDIQPRRSAPDVAVSAVSGEGLSDLKKLVVRWFGLDGFDPGAARAFTERQAAKLNEAAEALDRGDPHGGQVALRALLQG